MPASVHVHPLYDATPADEARAILRAAIHSEVADRPVGAVPSLRLATAARTVVVLLGLVGALVVLALAMATRSAGTPSPDEVGMWWATWIALAGLPPMSAVAAGAFATVAAAENRGAPDERPVPVVSWRRHALLWASGTFVVVLGAGSLGLPGVTDASWLVLVAALGAAAGVVAATEVGIALGRQRHRALVAWSLVATVVWAVLFLGGATASAALGVLASFAVALLVIGVGLRVTVRDTRPGVPVWCTRSGELMALSHRLPVTVVIAILPLAAAALGLGSTPDLAILTVFVATASLLSSFGLSTLPLFAGPHGSRRVVLARRRLVVAGAALAGATSVIAWIAVGLLSAPVEAAVAGIGAALLGWAALCWTYLAARRSRRVHVAWVAVAVALVLVPRAGSTAGVVWALLAVGAVSLGLGLLLAVTLSETGCDRAPAREALPSLSTDPFASPLALWSESPTLDLTVVVPFLHPGRDLLAANLRRLVSALDAGGTSLEVIAVDDGSHDDSGLAVRDVADPRVRLVTHSRNHGKGGALATGFMNARGRWIGFVDADGDIDAAHLRAYLAAALACDADIVVADKLDERSRNGSSAGRRLTSTAMHLVNRRLLRLSTADTQTGAKVYRRPLLQEALPRMWENGFAFDVEMFVVADSLGYRRLLRMPVTITRDGGSTVTTRSTLRTAARVLVVWRRQVLGDYHYGRRTWLPAEVVGGHMRASGILPMQRDVPASERRSRAEPHHWGSAHRHLLRQDLTAQDLLAQDLLVEQRPHEA